MSLYQTTDTPGAQLNTIYAEDINQFAQGFTAQRDLGILELAAPIGSPATAITTVLQAGVLSGSYQWGWYWITGNLDGTATAHITGRTSLSPLTVAQTLASQECAVSLPNGVSVPLTAIGWGLARNKAGGSNWYVVTEQFANLSGAMPNSYTDNASDASLSTPAPAANSTGASMTYTDSLSSYASDNDANDVYLTVTYKRTDGTTYLVSQLSNPVASTSQYQTDTWTYYAADGTTSLGSVVWTITYDASGKITSKVRG